MKLIIFTDLHYYAGDRETAIFGKAKKLTQYAPSMLEQLVEKVNHEYKPDAVLNLGDSIQDANDHDADVISLKKVAEKVKEFACPYYMVLGNHDLKMFDSHREAAEIFGVEGFNFTVELGGYRLVFVTHEVRPELGTTGGGITKTHTMGESTVAWLKNELKTSKLPCLIFTHYAIHHEKPNAIPLDREQVLAAIHESGNVRAVFSGHTHVAETVEQEGIVNYILGSPTADLTVCGTPDAVYYEVDIEGDDITVKEHLFEVRE
ncbi:MAG: metallophosphoesterase [Clostridia bacterium]|nr:metallophosphoesterase [Clostridia bacterium]